jgi:hypothetical protein
MHINYLHQSKLTYYSFTIMQAYGGYVDPQELEYDQNRQKIKEKWKAKQEEAMRSYQEQIELQRKAVY